MATVPISKGMPIRKFGQIIGVAQTDIPAGEWVHEHNIAFDSFERDYAIASEARPLQASVSDELAEFQGYRRSSGKFGTRNYLGILTSVNCSATVARLIAREAERLDLLAEYPQVDGIIPLSMAPAVPWTTMVKATRSSSGRNGAMPQIPIWAVC